MPHPFSNLLKALRQAALGKGEMVGPLSRKMVEELPRASRIRSKAAVDKVRKISRCENPNCKSKGNPVLHVHHIKSRGSGGGDAEDNLARLCLACHSLAHAGVLKPEEVYAMIVNREPKDKK